jgi:hypothetical protein
MVSRMSLDILGTVVVLTILGIAIGMLVGLDIIVLLSGNDTNGY